MFLNDTNKWTGLGIVGPFTLVAKPEIGYVNAIECFANDTYGISGADVVRFDPPFLIFTELNYTSEAAMRMLVHDSYPKGLKLPETHCHVNGYETNDIDILANNTGEKDDWILVSHMGPFSVKDKLPTGFLQVLTCQAEAFPEMIRFDPPYLVFDASNQTLNSFVSVFIKSDFPEDQHIPQPHCFISNHMTTQDDTSSPMSYYRNSQTAISEPNRLSQLSVALLAIFFAVLYVESSKKDTKKKNDSIHAGSMKRSKKSKKFKSKQRRKPSSRPTQYSWRERASLSYYVQESSDDDSFSDEEEEESKPTIRKLPKLNRHQNEQESLDGWEMVRQGSLSRKDKKSQHKTSFTRFVFKRNRVEQKPPESIVVQEQPESIPKATEREPDKQKADESCRKQKPSSCPITEPLKKGEEDETFLTQKPSSCPFTEQLKHGEVDETCFKQKPSSCPSTGRLKHGEIKKTDELDMMLAECAPQVPLQEDESYAFTLFIDGMTCGGCVAVVQATLGGLHDVVSVNVDLKLGKAILTSPIPRLDLTSIIAALDAVGFRVYMGADPTTTKGNKVTSPLRPPPGFEKKQETSLSLLDDIRSSSVPLRRYRCGCGEKECICSSNQVHKDDPGKVISLNDLCHRLESTFHSMEGGSSLYHFQPRDSSLEEIFRSKSERSELRDQLASIPIPCGCGHQNEEETQRKIRQDW